MIGIVILNYNDSDTTIKMINQIKDYKILNDIIIVDNKSTDNSYDILKKYEKNNIKVYQTKENKGYAAGNNFGIRKIIDKDEFIIISNPDIILKEEDIIKLKDDFSNEEVSLIAPKISQRGQIIKGWKLPNFKDEVLSNLNYFHKYADIDMKYNENYYKEKLTNVDVVSGCFFIIRSDVLKDIDYFDEGTFLYYEENILAFKLKDKGYNSYIDNDIIVIHDLSVSVDKSIKSLNKYKILKKSQMYYEEKYMKINKRQRFVLRLTYYISLFNAYIIRLFRWKK